ncbi:MAG: MarR family transcriptional regulator [Leptospirales bacterium]|nr:MarR family transcriptional regulator [Leptospirales bacterium]
MAAKFKGSARDRVVLDSYVKLIRASGSVERDMARAVASAGLTHGQFAVLEALYHVGPMSQTDLGQKLLSTDGNITHIVTNLEKRSLVKRIRNTRDRRFLTVELSARGKSLVARLFPAYVKRLRQRLEHLSEGELKSLSKLLKKLGLGGLRLAA